MKNNIYEKLSKASGKFVKKDDKKNGMHFNPLSHDAVQRVAMKALAEENLYPYCTYKNFFIQDNYVCTTCVMTIIDLDNTVEHTYPGNADHIVIETHAIAKADKYGSGNAMSYARKYAFLNALNLKTGLEDEQEEAIDSEDGFPAEPLTNKKKEEPKQKKVIDETYIGTELSRVEDKLKEKNLFKKDFDVLWSDIENLKSQINQSMDWDAFSKTDKFIKFNALRNQITKKRRS